MTSPSESRYVYFGAVLVLLLAVELLRGTRLSHRAFAVVGALVAVAALGNFGSLRNGSLFLQEWSGVVLAELGAGARGCSDRSCVPAGPDAAAARHGRRLLRVRP